VQELRHVKTGIKMSVVHDKQNISYTVFDGTHDSFLFSIQYIFFSDRLFSFSGRILVTWCLTFFKLANRADAVGICKSLMIKKVLSPLPCLILCEASIKRSRRPVPPR